MVLKAAASSPISSEPRTSMALVEGPAADLLGAGEELADGAGDAADEVDADQAEQDDGQQRADADGVPRQLGGGLRLGGAPPEGGRLVLLHLADDLADPGHLAGAFALADDRRGGLESLLLVGGQPFLEALAPGGEGGLQVVESALVGGVVGGQLAEAAERLLAPARGGVVGLEVGRVAGDEVTALAVLGVPNRGEDRPQLGEDGLGVGDPAVGLEEPGQAEEGERADEEQEGEGEAEPGRDLLADGHGAPPF
jgi:hypothetical protein